jgi:uncharacterized protein (TIGR03790 family)
MHADIPKELFYRRASACICGLLFLAQIAIAQGPAHVLIVVNENSPLSRKIGEYYARRRAIPADHICRIRTSTEETITRAVYTRDIAGPVASYLRKNQLSEKILYIVMTQGMPLRIKNESGSALTVDGAAVDSELTLLYLDMHAGKPHAVTGSLPNPFFGKTNESFSHPAFPVYLVTRLAAYDFDGVKGLIDRALEASNRGKFVIDMKTAGSGEGDNWMRDAAVKLAALHLPDSRLVLDQSSSVIYDQSDVIGYAGWGSNDNRSRRFLGFHWLPGAIMTEFVSTNARTFARPPENWTISDWNSPKLWFAGSPQTMTADYIQEGVTGASGHVDEPYLMMCPRPDFLLPAYYSGRNLAESYYLAIRALSWQNVVIGDPLCSIGKP